jgi:hypothetical protein
MSDVYTALRRTVRGLGIVGATRNAGRERLEHARIHAEVDALAQRLAPPALHTAPLTDLKPHFGMSDPRGRAA